MSMRGPTTTITHLPQCHKACVLLHSSVQCTTCKLIGSNLTTVMRATRVGLFTWQMSLQRSATVLPTQPQMAAKSQGFCQLLQLTQAELYTGSQRTLCRGEMLACPLISLQVRPPQLSRFWNTTLPHPEDLSLTSVCV